MQHGSCKELYSYRVHKNRFPPGTLFWCSSEMEGAGAVNKTLTAVAIMQKFARSVKSELVTGLAGYIRRYTACTFHFEKYCSWRSL